jgi:hypothetical protein
MKIRDRARSLAMASMLALALMSLPAAQAYAATNVVKAGCEGAGYIWSDTKGCSNRSCGGWPYGNGEPGEISLALGTDHAAYCDGFTGQWTQVSLAPQAPLSEPAAPRTGGTASPTGTTPSGPRAPLPTTNQP